LEAAIDCQELTNNNIKSVLSVMYSPIPDSEKCPGVEYKHIRFYDILTTIPETNRIIDESRQKNEGILVHCMAGVSRSASVVIAYLMFKNKKPYKEVRSIVQRIRSFINPNEGFVQQLVLYEQMNYTIDANFGQFRQFLIRAILCATRVGQYYIIDRLDNNIERYLNKVSIAEGMTANLCRGSQYLCAKCGFTLCHEINVCVNDRQKSGNSCNYTYIELQNWMTQQIYEFRRSEHPSKPKVIFCPKCREVVIKCQNEFQSFVCNCVQHIGLKCIHFLLIESMFRIEDKKLENKQFSDL